MWLYSIQRFIMHVWDKKEREREKKCQTVQRRKGGKKAEEGRSWRTDGWMAGQQTFNSVRQTGERDGDREVAEGCQEYCSVWDSTSNSIRTDENSVINAFAAQHCKASEFQI